MSDTVPAADVADLVAAIRDMLDPPDAATDPEARNALVCTRASYLATFLADARPGNAGGDAALIREAARHFAVRYQAAGEGDAR